MDRLQFARGGVYDSDKKGSTGVVVRGARLRTRTDCVYTTSLSFQSSANVSSHARHVGMGEPPLTSADTHAGTR